MCGVEVCVVVDWFGVVLSYIWMIDVLIVVIVLLCDVFLKCVIVFVDDIMVLKGVNDIFVVMMVC